MKYILFLSVVRLPKRKILFGVCFVKAEDFSNLSNVAEADHKEWPKSIHSVMEKFPAVQEVVPRHGTWSGPNLLQHTEDLLKK